MPAVELAGLPNPLLAVVGPTGSGKSDLALALAAEFGGEIVNFDSVQLYRGFDIGSAKLPAEERRGIPHHLLDIAEPHAEVSAGEYARLATDTIKEITSRGKLPVLAGGTGFYLRALLDGLSPAPARQRGLRERLLEAQQRRPNVLFRFLRRFDPPAAARIHRNDIQKLMRAVEMSIAANRPVTHIHATPGRGLSGHRILNIGLQPGRDLLSERLNQRTAWMFAHGLLEETQRLLNGGVSPESRPMGSLGYRQAVAVLEGRLTVEEAITECQARTRQYAKRQMTWFRSEKDVRWLHGFGTDPAIAAEAREWTRYWLSEAHC